MPKGNKYQKQSETSMLYIIKIRHTFSLDVTDNYGKSTESNITTRFSNGAIASIKQSINKLTNQSINQITTN